MADNEQSINPENQHYDASQVPPEVQRAFTEFLIKTDQAPYEGSDKERKVSLRPLRVIEKAFYTPNDTDEPFTPFERVERSYYEKGGPDGFKQSAYIGFERNEGNSDFVIREVEKSIETGGGNLANYRYMNFENFGGRPYLKFDIGSPVLDISMVWSGNVFAGFNPPISQVDSANLPSLGQIKQSPARVKTDKGDLDFAYDHTTNSFILTSTKEGEVQRKMRIPVEIDTQDIAKKMSSGIDLYDPYADYNEDDWIKKDFEATIGIEEITDKSNK